MKENSNKKEINLTKTFAQKIVSMICVFLSFFILNLYFVSLMDLSFSNFSSWVGNFFFTLSWISFFIGIIYSFRGIFRNISLCVLYFLFVVIAYLESLSFIAKGEFVQLFRDFSVPFSKWISYTSQEFILYLFLSFFFVILSCSFFNRGNILPLKGYSKVFFYLGIILCFGICRGIAYYSLGPQVVYTSGKQSDDSKTIYLEYKNKNENLKISGLYDFAIRGFYDEVVNQWKKTDTYLRKE